MTQISLRNKIDFEETLRRVQIMNQEEDFRKYQVNLNTLSLEISEYKEDNAELTDVNSPG